MGLLGQLGLLLRKNLKLRLRAPALTLIQLLWPVIVFVVIALVRTRFQPQETPNCYYDAKAMPSRGLVPFMQSFMCDLSTSCKPLAENGTTKHGNELPAYHLEARFAQIANGLDPIFSNSTTVESFMKLPEAIKPLAELSDTFNSESLTNFTEKRYRLADFFHNASDVRRYLVEGDKLDLHVVDALLAAEVDVYQLLESTGFVDFKGIVCNATRLNEVLTFSHDVKVNAVSEALCNVQDEDISIIVDELQTQLDIPYLIDEFAQFLKALDQTDWSLLLKNASAFLDQLESIGNLGDFVEGLPNLLDIVRMIPTLRDLFSQFEQGTLEKQLDVVVKLMESIDTELMNATWWMDLKSIVAKAHDVLGTVTTYLNHFEDNIIPLGSLFRNETTVHRLLEQQFNITNEDVKAILQLQLNPDKIAELLQLVKSTDNPADLICSPGRFDISEFITLPPGGISSSIASLQHIFCNISTNGDNLLKLLLNSTDILLLVDQVNGVVNNPPTAVQWKALLNDVLAISASFQDLPYFIHRLPELLESFPQLLGSFEQSILPSIDWNKLLAASLHGDMSMEDVLKLLSSEPFVSIIQDALSQTPAWHEIEYQLINQHMMLDIQLGILGMFTGGTCPDGWHSNDLSCYRYVHDITPDIGTADNGCNKFHHRTHLLSVNHETEQKFIESIGEDTVSWLGLAYDDANVARWFQDWSRVDYQNWITSPQIDDLVNGTYLPCAIANFGTDGLWHHADCLMPAESYICEAVQAHKLVELLKNEPVSEITRVLLELGPNVTEAVIRTFLNSSYIEALLKMSANEQAMALCTVDLSTLHPSVDVAEVRQTLCSLNLTLILMEQMQYWQIPGLESQLRDYLAFMEVNPGSIPIKYAHLANLSAIIQKNGFISDAWADIFARPVDLEQVIDGYDDIIGNQSEEWKDMIYRVCESLSIVPLQGLSNAPVVDILEALNVQLGNALDMLDWTDTPAEWTAAKELISSGQRMLSSLLGLVAGDQGQGLSLGSLLHNDSIFRDLFQSRLNLSAQDVQIMQQSTINMDKIVELLLHLATRPQNPATLFCSGQLNLLDYITFPENTTKVGELAGSLQRVLCYLGNRSTNATALLDTLLMELDLTMLADQLGAAAVHPTGTIQDWGLLLQMLVNMTDSLQHLPSFFLQQPDLINIFQKPLNISSDWGGIIDWLQDNVTFVEAVSQFGSEIYPALFEKYLARTDLWPAIQHQLVVQNLMMDFQLAIVRLLTGGTCKDGWYSNDLSCYQYVDEVGDWFTSEQACRDIHPRSSIVSVNTQEEQLYLQSIGQDKESWLGVYVYSPFAFWVHSGLEVDYNNWAPSSQQKDFICVKANFGMDGLWLRANCSVPLESVICEAMQDHILVKHLQEQPFVNATRTLLELGPNVTESVIRAFLNLTKLQMLLNMSRDDQSMLFCNEDFVTLQPPDATTRQKLCNLSPLDILNEQSAFWNIAEIEAMFNRLQAFLTNPNSTTVPPEYAHYANLSEVILKNQLLSTLIEDAAKRPFHPSALWEDSDAVITGSGAEWQEMLTRISTILNEELLMQWMDMSTAADGSMLNTSLLQYNMALLQLSDTILRATNQVFTIIQEFAAGQVFSGAMPETERFLRGIMGLIDEGPALLGSIGEAWNDPSKQATFQFVAADIGTIFCDDTLRRAYFSDQHPINTSALDNYLCVVNYDILADELKMVVPLDDIISQIIGITTESFNTTVFSTVSVADLMENIDTLKRNIETLPHTILSWNNRYNVSSLANVADALFQATLMGFDSLALTNASNEVNLERIFQNIPVLNVIVKTLSAYKVVDLKELHTYVAFMNLYIDRAKENSCREGWQSHDYSCYRYMNEARSSWATYYGCRAQQSHPVTVDTRQEQMFLQSIGPNTDVWLNGYTIYQNYASQDPGEVTGCTKANFGGDGVWYHANCSDSYSYICEAMPELNITLRLLGLFTNDSTISRVINVLEKSLGIDTVNTILASPLNPVQLSHLLLVRDWQNAVCRDSFLRDLFIFPDSFNVTQLGEVVCSWVFTETALALYNNTHVFDQFWNDWIASFQEGDFNLTSFIKDTDKLLQHFASFDKYKVNSYIPFKSNPFSSFTLFNETSWEQAWSVESLLISLDPFDLALINETWYRNAILQISSVAYFTEYFTDRILVLKGKHLVLPEIRNLVVNITETERLFEVIADFTPEMTDLLLRLVVQPDKLEDFLSFANPLATLCDAGNFSLYFTLPANASVDLMALEGAVCSVDLLQVELELRRVFPIDTFMTDFGDYVNTSSSDSLPTIAHRFITLFEKTSAFIQDPFTVNINETWLWDTFNEAVEVLQQWSMNEVDMLNSKGDTSMVLVLQRLEAEFINQSWWNDIGGPIRKLISVIEYANMKLEPLPGRNITFFDLLPPATAELLQMLMKDFPDILGVLTHSYVNLTKLDNLTGPNDWVDLICNSTTGLRAIINIPPDVNASALHSVLCSFDYGLLSEEWSQEVSFIFEERRNTPLNWTASYESVLSLIQTLSNLNQSSPLIDIYNADWFNQKLSQTEDILQTLLPINQDISGAELDNLLQYLDAALSGTGEYYDSFTTQFRLEDYINRFLIDQLQMFIGQNWTFPALEGLFADATSVRSLFSLWDVTPDIVDAVLSLSIQPQMLSSFWEMSDPFATLCSTDQFASFFEHPLSSSQTNLTSIQQAICSINLTLIQWELSQHYNLSKIQLDIDRIYRNDPSLGPFNWTSWIANRNQLTEVITGLFSAPPKFMVDPAWSNETASRLQDVLDIWFVKLQEMATRDQANSTRKLLQELEATLQSLGAWDVVRPYLEIFKLALEGTATQLRHEGAILRDMFNSSTFLYILNTSLSVTPDQLEASLAASAFSVFELAQIHNQPGAWDSVFCNSTAFNIKYPLPPAVNSTAVQQAMCMLNQTQFFITVSEMHGIDILKLQPQLAIIFGLPGAPYIDEFGWERLLQYAEEISALLTELQNIPGFPRGEGVRNMTLKVAALLRDIGQRNAMHVIQVLQDIRPYFQDDSVLTEIRDSFQTFVDLTNMIDSFSPQGTLPVVEAELQRLNVWYHVKPYLEFANVLLDGINKDLHPGGEAIPQFLYNRTVLDRFLQATIDSATPELAQAILVDRFYPISFLAYLHLSNNWDEELCTQNDDDYGLPSEINGTALRQQLCNLDRMEFFGMLDNITGVDVLRLQQAMFEIGNILPLSSNYTNPQFDWDTLVGNAESIIATLQGIMGLPGLGYHGDFAEAAILFQNLQEGLAQFNLKLSIEILEQLDVLMNRQGVWSEIQGLVSTAAHFAQVLNQQIEFLTESNFTIEGVFNAAAPDFLAQFFTPENVQSVMNASINPALLGVLTQPEQLTSILCDSAQFKLFVVLPQEADIDTIQRTLCSLASANETFLRDLRAVFLNGIIPEELLLGNMVLNGSMDINWHESLQTFQLLAGNLMALPVGHDFLGNFLTQWLATYAAVNNLPPVFANLTSDYTSLCQSLPSTLLNTTIWQTIFDPALVSTNLVMEIVKDLVLTLPSHQQELQKLLNNMTTIVELLSVFTEVEQSLVQSGTAVLFDYEKVSVASNLTLFLLRRDIAKGLVCDEEDLRLITGIPNGTNLTDISTLFCGVEKLIQTRAVQELLRIVGFSEILPKISAVFGANRKSYEPLDCPALITNTQGFIKRLVTIPSDYGEFINSLERPEYFDLIALLPQIVRNASYEDIQGLTELYHLVQPLLGPLFGNSNHGNGTNMDMLLPYLELIDSYLISQLDNTELVDLSSLWSNISVVKQYLSTIEGFSPDIIRAIINSQLNTSALPQLQDNMTKHLCRDSMLFSQLFVFNDSIIASEVHHLICTALNASNVLDFMTGSLNVTELIRAITMTSPMVLTLPEYLDELLVALEDFSALDPAILDGFVSKQLPMLIDGHTNTTELLQLAMSAKDLIKIAKSFQPVIDILQPLLKDDPTFQTVQTLLKSLTSFDGLLDLIGKLPDLSLSKLFKNPGNFREFLVEDIGFSQQVASDLLSGSLRLEVAASVNFSSVSGIVCNEATLTKIIKFPEGTNVTGVQQSLCDLTSEQLAVVLDGVVQRLNVGTLIQELLTYSLVERFGNTTSLDDLSQAVDDLGPIQETLQTLMTEFESFDLNSIAVEDIVDSLMGNAAAQSSSSTDSVSEFVCGEGASISLLPPDALGSVSARRKRSVGPSRMRRDNMFDAVPTSTPFCTSLYESIQGSDNGQLIWHYIKPVLLGKITYAPDNKATAKIIKESNFFFEEISTIRDLAKVWLAGSDDLRKLVGSRQLNLIEKFLRNSYTKEILQVQLNLDADVITSLLSSDLSTISVDDLKQFDLIAQLIVNMTDCIDLDRFIPLRTEGALEVLSKRYSSNNTLFAGVYFNNLREAKTLPPHIQYKIRMDVENTPATDQLKDKDWTAGANNRLIDQVYARGFIFLQDMIEKGIIRSQTDSNVKTPGVYIQLMPYPCHIVDQFVERFAYLLPLLLTFVFMGTLASMTYQLVYEKELGIEELMKAMGLRSGLNLFSWFLNNLVLMAILCAVMVIILKVGNILPSSDGSLLFVFLLCFSWSLIMMCYLISTLFQTAYIASLAAILIYLMTYIPYIPYLILETTLDNFHQKALFSLFSTCAFTLGCNEIALKEAQTIGVQWDTFAEGFHQVDEFGFNWMCVSMLWDGLLYFVIGWYISALFPGRHGVPKPWYFVFLPCYWCSCFHCKSTASNKDIYARAINKNPDVEIDPANNPLGISVVGLTKKYSKKKTAVDNLTLNFYEDQITSFLGRNGAGKTTTISIIMGLFPASAGKVFIYGKDVMQRLHSTRKDLGFCPQHDALYDQLTVQEHLEMYGRLKGMSLKDIFQQSQDLISDVGLQDAANEKVCKLSGGMKRKLSVIIAFLGGSNIVILDEPTSGVDPHARRSIWDLIVKNKKGRTILLCTHFMDEADLLGDRIAILDKGQLRCCGSSAFLKNHFTNGYTLTVAKELPSKPSTSVTGSQDRECKQKRAVANIYVDPDDLKKIVDAEEAASTSSQESSSGVSSLEGHFSSNEVTSLIQSHLPSAVFKEDIGTEVSYTLPVSLGQTAKFQALFQELDAKLPELHATSYGLSDATLEEVFLKVSSTAEDGSVDEGKDMAKMIPESTLKRAKTVYNMEPTTLRQFLAILTKRFYYARHDWWGLVWGLLIPILWLLLAIAFSSIKTGETYPALHFAPSLYGPGDYVFFSNSDSKTLVGEKMTNALFSDPGLGTTCMRDFENSASSCHFVEPFFSQPISKLTDTEQQNILETDRNAPVCSCSQSFLECPGGAAGVDPPEWVMNTTDILLDASLKVDLNEYLLRTTADFRFKRYNGLSFHSIKNSDGGETEEVVKAWYNNKGFHAMPTSLNTINNVILRSFLSAGQDQSEYGISAYNHPFHFSEEELSTRDLWDQTAEYFGICMMVMVAFSLIPATFAMFPVMENINGSKRLHYISGVTPCGYWIANLIWDLLMYVVPIGISLIIVYAFSMQAFSSASNMPAFCLLLFMYGFAIACQMYLLVPLFKTTGTAFIVIFCLGFLVALLTVIPRFLQESPLGEGIGDYTVFDYIDKVFLIFSPFCLASGLINLLYNQVRADIFKKFEIETYQDPFSLEVLGWRLIALAIEGAVAFLLLLIIEYKCRYQCGDCKSGSNDHHGLDDEDVAIEKKRVASGEAKKDLVCIKNLTKVYRSVDNSSLVAVDNVCLGVPRGECFGLIGVNGAGKTSTFRMIVKDLTPTHGSIRVSSKSVGYCPQVDALYNPLTGTELLYCYAKIKGITGKQCRMAVKCVSSQMRMGKYINNRIGTYSGGMKRSLSTAVALLGNPQVVLMDEPTTGMDPVTKQVVWCNILAMIKNGHSVILTSHSMEECELLCTRLAIMVNGRFHCLGSPQHVKHRHGDGYTLILRLSDETPNVTNIMQFVSNKFPGAVLKEKHHNMVQYQLPMTTSKLADIFGAVEEEKAHLGIQEYSVTQTTLDQVFVNFAKRQTDGHKPGHESVQDYINHAFSTAGETDELV